MNYQSTTPSILYDESKAEKISCCMIYYCRIVVVITFITLTIGFSTAIITSLYTNSLHRSGSISFNTTLITVANSSIIHIIDEPTNTTTTTSCIATTRIVPTTCPLKNTNNYCTTTAYTVMAGLDVVQYFTTFRQADGSYDESRVGMIGYPRFEVTYYNYKFNFISKENKLLFMSDPGRYIPQYGGFCAWAVAGESNYPWSATCMGPAGNTSAWTIINDKLYFFKDMTPKRFFLADYRYSISAGDDRWSRWRTVVGLGTGTGSSSGSNKTIIFNTNCTANQHSLLSTSKT